MLSGQSANGKGIMPTEYRWHKAMAPYACANEGAGKRLHSEPESATRPPFQRDCDRLVHTTAFRRLMHKTQVFFDPEGDHLRTRLTHTLEVARVSRSIAARLGLNADLAEAVALAHDLGHAPFGHAGEDALVALMQAHGGFDHNAQAIRIVTWLERTYIGFDGINLTWDTLEGIAKHNGPINEPAPYALAHYNAMHDLRLHSRAGAEAQVAAIADDIAYNCHDLQDGIRAGFFGSEEISALPILDQAYAELRRRHPDIDGERIDHAALRSVFAAMVEDVIDSTQRALTEAAPGSADGVRSLGRNIVGFSPGLCAHLDHIRHFLHQRLYRDPILMVARQRSMTIVADMFTHFVSNPDQLPGPWYRQASREEPIERVVTDYLAGMTDKFALALHGRIFGAH